MQDPGDPQGDPVRRPAGQSARVEGGEVRGGGAQSHRVPGQAAERDGQGGRERAAGRLSVVAVAKELGEL